MDAQGRAFVTGETYTDKFPLKNEIQGFSGVSEALLTLLNSSGSALEYSTMLGGGGRDKSLAHHGKQPGGSPYRRMHSVPRFPVEESPRGRSWFRQGRFW